MEIVKFENNLKFNLGMIRAQHHHHRPQHNKNLNVSGGNIQQQQRQHQSQQQQQQSVNQFPQFPQCATEVLCQVFNYYFYL